MTKGEETRERIIASAAPLFNTLGYAGTTMADLMEASGLEKGGIYRHFESKDELALAAFDYAWAESRDRVQSYINFETTSVGRLIAVARGMASLAEDPPIPGGCPLLNTATESDSAPGETYAAFANGPARASGVDRVHAEAHSGRRGERGVARASRSGNGGERDLATLEGGVMFRCCSPMEVMRGKPRST